MYYTVYIGNHLIYSPTLYREKYDILSPKMSSELNRSDNLSFTVPDTNPNYNYVAYDANEIKVYEDGERIFRGRLLTIDKNFYRHKIVYAEGELAYLNDACIRPYAERTESVANFFAYIIGQYNNSVDNYKQFVVGSCDITGTVTSASEEYVSAFSELTNKLVNVYGGYLLPRCEVVDGVEINYIDYLKEPGTGTQTIKFAENLLDLSNKHDSSDVFSVIIPLGAEDENTGERITIESVNSGSDRIVDSTLVSVYGAIEKVVIYDKITDPQILYDTGASLLSRIGRAQSIEVRAIDIRDLGVDVASFRIGYKYRLISAPHGFVESTDFFRLSRIDLDLQSPDRSAYVFGAVNPKISRK